MDREAREKNSSSPNDKISIEKLEYLGASCDTCRVTITGGSFFYLLSEQVEKWDIFESKPLTDELAEALLYAHREYLAYTKAFALIARSDHSEEMLKLKLKKRCFPEEICASVIEKLREKGFVDDELFASRYMEFALRKKHEGRRKLYARLLQKGIGRETADKTVSRVSDDEEEAALVTAWEKLMKKKKHATEEKMYRALLAKGFQYNDIRRFIREKISYKK